MCDLFNNKHESTWKTEALPPCLAIFRICRSRSSCPPPMSSSWPPRNAIMTPLPSQQNTVQMWDVTEIPSERQRGEGDKMKQQCPFLKTNACLMPYICQAPNIRIRRNLKKLSSQKETDLLIQDIQDENFSPEKVKGRKS